MLLNKGLSIAKHRLMLDLLAVFKYHLNSCWHTNCLNSYRTNLNNKKIEIELKKAGEHDAKQLYT
jgi:hypothetical protein